MAFSTQKEFFQVPFMNESYDFECTEVCVKLKSYPSTVDDRSWAANEDKKSRFVADLVACNTPVGSRRAGAPGDGGGGGGPGTGAGTGTKAGAGTGARAAPPGSGTGRPGDDAAAKYGRDGNLVVGDSLINAADDTMGRVEDLLVKNKMLQKRLDDSNDRLKTAKEENAEIKRIMNQRYDKDKGKALGNKIKELEDSGKITPKDAQELAKLKDSIEDMNKAYDILQAENGSLRRLIEKQARRCKMDSIKIDPEKSKDVNYLQNKIDDMGKELAVLRQAEDEFMKGKGGVKSGQYSPENDPNAIREILAERDSLRKKVKALKAIEGKVNDLEKKAQKADNLSNDLTKNLQNQSDLISDMENDMQEMQGYYEKEIEKGKFNEEVLTCRCQDLKKELTAAKCSAERADCLQMEIDVLRNELRKREVAINAYDCQYQQLMNVICELNDKYGNKRDDCPGFDQQCTEVGDDLAFFTGATLEHIINEICKQSECFRKMNEEMYGGDGREINTIVDCMEELKRLKNVLKARDKQLCEMINENGRLSITAVENGKRLNELDQMVKDLDKDTKYMEEGMRDSIGLIKEIGDVAKENERLKGKMDQLKDIDVKNLLGDLRAQLEAAKEKNRLCQEQNDALGSELKKLGVNPEEIRDAVKKKLEDEKKEQERAEAEKAKQQQEATSGRPSDIPAFEKDKQLDSKAADKPRGIGSKYDEDAGKMGVTGIIRPSEEKARRDSKLKEYPDKLEDFAGKDRKTGEDARKPEEQAGAPGAQAVKQEDQRGKVGEQESKAGRPEDLEEKLDAQVGKARETAKLGEKEGRLRDPDEKSREQDGKAGEQPTKSDQGVEREHDVRPKERGLKTGVQSPITDAQTRKSDGQVVRPGEQVGKLGEQAGKLGEQERKQPEGPRKPGEKARKTEDDATKPGDERRKPMDEGRKPGDEATKPGDQARKPGDEARRPGDAAKRPGDEPTKPGDQARKPEDEARKPEDAAKRPGDQARKPGEEGRKPREEARKPGEDIRKPGEEARKTGEDARKPGEDARKPGEEAKKISGKAREPTDKPIEKSFKPREEKQEDRGSRPVEQTAKPGEQVKKAPQQAGRPGSQATRRQTDDRPDEQAGAGKPKDRADKLGERLKKPEEQEDKQSELAGMEAAQAGRQGEQGGRKGEQVGKQAGQAGKQGAQAGKLGEQAGKKGDKDAEKMGEQAGKGKPGVQARKTGDQGGRAEEQGKKAGEKQGEQAGKPGEQVGKKGEQAGKIGDEAGKDEDDMQGDDNAQVVGAGRQGDEAGRRGDQAGKRGEPADKRGDQAGRQGDRPDRRGDLTGRRGDEAGRPSSPQRGRDRQAVAETGDRRGRPDQGPTQGAKRGGKRSDQPDKGRPADELLEGEETQGDGRGGGQAGRPGGTKRKPRGGKGHTDEMDTRMEDQFDAFVKQTATTLSAGEIDGFGLERELRKILDMFIDECGFCFCKCNIPKSRFYAICHKLYHHGLHTLEFKDLAYMHKRIYAAAENLLPGCLFNIIMKDMEATSSVVTPLAVQRCCSCKNTLCCDTNEEKLMMKVMRLEHDIENAKLCLRNLKIIPTKFSKPSNRLTAGGDGSL